MSATSGTSTRQIGDVDVFPIGLGEMPLSVEGRPDAASAIRTVHAALDAGVTLIDTADAYCLGEHEFGHGEEIVRRALDAWSGDRDAVLVATKGGHTRTGTEWTLDGSPAYLRRACEASLRRLGVEAIGLWQVHRPDPRVPVERSVGALRDLLDEGKIRLAGVSNFDAGQIRMAHDALGGRLAAVQNEFSPRFRSSLDELRLCAELGIAFLPWSPLGGMSNAAGLGASHAAFAEVAQAHDASPQQVCLAWELAQSDVVVPIPGSSRPETILDSVRAAELRLSGDDLARLDSA